MIKACEEQIARGLWDLKSTREIIKQLQPKPMKYAEIGVGWGATSLHVSEELLDGAEIFLIGYDDEVNAVVNRFATWKHVQELAGKREKLRLKDNSLPYMINIKLPFEKCTNRSNFYSYFVN